MPIRLIHSAGAGAGAAATPQSTAAFLAKHPALPTAILPKRGLTLSKLGFGAYRVNRSQPAHRAALIQAIQAGVNVIDTSSHFGHGDSESFIGTTLADLFKQGTLRREVRPPYSPRWSMIPIAHTP
ncbi:hypothetical protein BGZ67_003107 [Mortierella alpina]|nr:hypothetical protein BGZ67_003107 [Mortierella alpina]